MSKIRTAIKARMRTAGIDKNNVAISRIEDYLSDRLKIGEVLIKIDATVLLQVATKKRVKATMAKKPQLESVPIPVPAAAIEAPQVAQNPQPQGQS